MTTLNVSGMTCGHCAMHVKKALTEVPGVDGVEVDLESGVAKITGNAEAEALIAAVEDAGYDAKAA